MAQTDPVLQRQVSIQAGASTPDFQKSTQDLAAAQNNLSAIGAQVAQSANNQMAVQLGYESGKTPHGDLTPPITEFDKNFQESYHTQAQATLALQGQQLLDDAQVEMAKPNRLTPKLIADTHAQLQIGLNKIAENAPIAIKGKLQSTFDSQILDQTTKYKEKMISQQREDQKNTIINALDLNTKNALELASNGDFKGAMALVDSSKNIAGSAASNNYLTPETARVAHESVKQAALDGQYTYLAKQALNSGKYAEFQKQYSETDPASLHMTNEQFINTGQAFSRQINFLQSLRTQDENLTSQQMINRIALDPTRITGNEWSNFESSVSPMKAEQVKYKYIQAMKAASNVNTSVDDLIKNYGNPEAQAAADPKVKNAAFTKSVDYTVQHSQGTDNPLSHEDAEVQVAATAGAPVPIFINDIKNKLHSGNPAFMESASKQITQLEQMQAGHALVGLNDQDKALNDVYKALRDSRDPVTAARDTVAAVLNQDPAVQQANQQKWANILHTATSGGTSTTQFALAAFNLKQNDFINPSMAQVYGADILKKYSTLFQIANGDQNVAKTMTQKYIDANYGETGVNGSSYKTMHPLEMVLGYKDKSAVPFIQQDAIDQMNEKFVPIKKMYDDKKSNEYWETLPLTGKKHGLINTTYDPIQVKQHIRTPEGEKTNTYNVVLQGNAFNWDVAIQSDSGMRNLFQVAPYLGVLNYQPNAKAIQANYMKHQQAIPPESSLSKVNSVVDKGFNLLDKGVKNIMEAPRHPPGQ